MPVRALLLKIHLWLGVGSAIFLVILGLTGAIIAFENDIDHWIHPDLFYVQTGATTRPEAELIGTVEQRFAPARVTSVHIYREPNLARSMQLNDRSTVYISPYDGRILGRTTGPSTTAKIVGYIHQLHTHLVPDPRSARKAAEVGAVLVQIVGFMLCLLVPIGVVLWWRMKRVSIKWKSSWSRVCFDAHNMLGIFAALFLFIAAVTGVLVERGTFIMRLTGSAAPTRFPKLISTPVAGTLPISVDRAVEAARSALPGIPVTDIQLPANARGVYTVILRVPEETSEAAHSFVFVDQYTGTVLNKVNFLTDSFGYRVIRFNRAVHTGDALGTPGHVILSLSSLALVAMVITGLVIWVKKLAV